MRNDKSHMGSKMDGQIDYVIRPDSTTSIKTMNSGVGEGLPMPEAVC
jgi:hypothetical protein